MTIPARSDEILAEEKKKQKGLRHLDLAYGCYAYIGLFILAGVALVTLASNENREGYAMAVCLPCYCRLLLWRPSRLDLNRQATRKWAHSA